MMRPNVALRMRTYPLVTSPLITPVDLWTLCGVTDSLQDGGLPGVRSSNNKHSELDIVGFSCIVPRRQIGHNLSHHVITIVARWKLVRGVEYV
jgi:hypothetical protein